MNINSIGIGFSHHSVPSLSNVATRSAGGTSRTAASTNATIDDVAAPSRHDGNPSIDEDSAMIEPLPRDGIRRARQSQV